VLGAPDDAVAQDTPADERVAAREERDVFLAALDELDIARRALLVMHDVDGTPVPEIAEALQVPVNTAYSRLRLAREDLAARVKRIRNARGGR
jgi:RNA polymerase sigma-70 factor (ECF subfamily)